MLVAVDSDPAMSSSPATPSSRYLMPTCALNIFRDISIAEFSLCSTSPALPYFIGIVLAAVKYIE